MTIRAFALLAVLFLSAGCAPPEEPAPPEDRPAALRDAEPRTAELLLGTWDVVSVNDRLFPIQWSPFSRFEFLADGRVIMQKHDPGRGFVTVTTRTYTLQGQTLRITNPKIERGGSPQTWVVVIASISPEAMLTSEPPGSDKREDFVFHRVKDVKSDGL